MFMTWWSWERERGCKNIRWIGSLWYFPCHTLPQGVLAVGISQTRGFLESLVSRTFRYSLIDSLNIFPGCSDNDSIIRQNDSISVWSVEGSRLDSFLYLMGLDHINSWQQCYQIYKQYTDTYRKCQMLSLLWRAVIGLSDWFCQCSGDLIEVGGGHILRRWLDPGRISSDITLEWF